MNITRKSMMSGRIRTLNIPITQEQLTAWELGALLQKAAPQLSKDQREFVITGITPDEWEELVGDDDDIELPSAFAEVPF